MTRRSVGQRLLASTAVVVPAVAMLAASAASASSSASGSTVAAVAPAGTLQAWGDDLNGQLGNGTTGRNDLAQTVQLPQGVTITAVAAGGKHTLALTSTGQVLAWGDNFDGQLGDGSNTDSHTPVAVDLPAGTVATAIAAGDNDSLAVTSTGAIYSWGNNHYGQLGDGSNLPSNVPVKVRLPRGDKAIQVGVSYNYAVALTSAGQVLTWGYNGSGQLGNGYETASEVPIPVKLPKGTAVRAIANGGYDGLALTASGRIWAWGDDRYGQLGDGTRSSALSPVQVKLPTGVKVVSIGAGSQHGLALTSTGKVLAWGWNAYGQLGNGSTKDSTVPVAVRMPAKYKITAISAGGGFSLALTAHGAVLAWGNNGFYQLGNGTANSDVPIQVQLPAGLSAIRLPAGLTTRHSLAIVRSS